MDKNKIRQIMLGQKLKELRESKGFVQRQVAAILQVDTAYVSKIENNEKPVSRGHLKSLSNLYEIDEDELLTMWLANKIIQLVDDEKNSIVALQMALHKLSRNNK